MLNVQIRAPECLWGQIREGVAVGMANKQTAKKFESRTVSTMLKQGIIAFVDFSDMLLLIKNEFNVLSDGRKFWSADRSKTVGDHVAMISILPRSVQSNQGPASLPSAT